MHSEVESGFFTRDNIAGPLPADPSPPDELKIYLKNQLQFGVFNTTLPLPE